jgi:Glycosyltransferase family 87
VKTAVLFVFLACAAAVIGLRPSTSLEGTDFPDFYCAARMLLDGRGSRLYDSALQYRYQAEYAGRIGTLYIHPPFEAIFYLSVAWLPLKNGYLLWTCLSLFFLAVASRALALVAFPTRNWHIFPVLALTFVPLLLCLMQGQDSIVLLLIVVLAYVALHRERNFSAGCWLALGLFKFQLVLPIILVLLLRMNGIRRRALASGFAAVTIALIALSAAISGWSVFYAYPKFLAHLSAQRFAGIIPSAMPNFRGLAYLIFHREQSPAAIAVVLVLSAVALFVTFNGWKYAHTASDLPPTPPHNLFDLAFSVTVIFALLVSYHLNPHDLTLLLLPISLILPCVFVRKPSAISEQSAEPILKWKISSWTTFVLLAILFLPLLYLLALKAQFFAYALLAVPVILLLTAISIALQQSSTPQIAPHVDRS